MIRNYLTFDIEDYFEPGELRNPTDWNHYESQVEENTGRILEILDRFDVKATFFVLGKIARRRPGIVRMIVKRNHILASHGDAHLPVKDLGREGFYSDLCKSKETLESLSGKSVEGFRAMGFSITEDVAWCLEEIDRAGYSFDSSVLAPRLWQSEELRNKAERLRKIPVTAVSVFGRIVPIYGGISLRLTPWFLMKRLISSANDSGKSVVAYMHAWEFNSDQPPRKVSFPQRVAQYPRTFNAPRRLEQLLNYFSFGPMS